MFEPFLQERIDLAKARAAKIIDGEVDSISGLIEVMTWVLSRHYNIPFFDRYFDARTLDDLVFEVELLKLARKTTMSGAEQGAEAMATASKDEKAGLMDDWVEADMESNKRQQEEDSKRFMQSGEFK